MMVELSQEETALLTKALDLLVKIHIGNLGIIPDMLMDSKLTGAPIDVESLGIVRDMIGGAQRILTGRASGGPGVHNPNVPQEARDALPLLRKLLAATNQPE